MKKLLLLATLIIVAITCANAQTWDSNNTTVTLSGSTLTVSPKPSTDGRMANYATTGSRPWHSSVGTVTTLIVEAGVSHLGNQVFSGCSELISVTLPDGLESIGGGVFYGCSKLTSITIPHSVTTIFGQAFSGCTNLKTVRLPNTLSSLADNVFANCTSLQSIAIPAGVTLIGFSAFWGCTALSSVRLPMGVTTIQMNAFQNCSSLKTLHLPASVNNIGGYAFANSGIKQLLVKNTTVPAIDWDTFRNFPTDAIIYVPDAAYDDYIIATNWSARASQIQKMSAYANIICNCH